MIDPVLQSKLQPVIRRQRRQALRWELAICWLAAALAGFGFLFLDRRGGWASSATMPVLGLLAIAASLILAWRRLSPPEDYRAIARRIEKGHPELNGLLLTAVQQEAPAEGEGAPGYLQRRLLDQALEHNRWSDWSDFVPQSRVRLAAGIQWAALALLIATFAGMRGGKAATDWTSRHGVVVTPGDANIERGESLVVLARFNGELPPGVTLAVRSSGEAPREVTLVKSLADPVFGTSLPEVDRDFSYHLEYGETKTREFKVSVFEFPRLERADAVLSFPSYTRLAPKRIEKTRRISAVEGTRMNLALQFNKPVASAELVARDAKKSVVPLQVAPDKASASLPEFPLLASQTYDLRLIDRDGRSNPLATPFVIDVQPDRPPEFHVTAPHGDTRPSPVEEVKFAGTLLGEFGVSAYGLAYTLAGGETRFVELGREVPAMEKRAFDTTLFLEQMGVRPDELISWYVWADDVGPDGKPRRSTGDLYFAEIRPFDEIFRESNAMQPSEGGEDGPDGSGGEGERLAELQKQIISATWKLQRDPKEPKYADDAQVVRESQNRALTQAGSARDQADDPRSKALWSAVTQQMKEALAQLQRAGTGPSALLPALASEQRAYQALLRLQSRDTRVARGRSGGGGRGGASQRQLEQLDLTQDPNRYETQKQATSLQSPERREQLQVMNRLQELARRQQDVNDRLKEMQTALEAARTEGEREDIKRQLKRLQEEQQQMLADVDELRQRMDQQHNQSAMSEQRRKIDQTRDEVQQAADAAGRGQVAEARSAGTRAQREFQEMHDALHKLNSSEFSDELRSMRAEARELATQEEDVARKLSPQADGGQRKRLSDAADDGPIHQIEEQKKRLGDLIERAKQVSQQAEGSEPLLAEKLYDSVRKLAQDDAGTVKEFQQELLNGGLMTRSLNERMTDASTKEGTKSLDLASALLQQGYLPQAGDAERRARAGIDELRDGVEHAADSVIGDDTAALKLARSELDTVTDELKREAAQSTAPQQSPSQIPGQSPSQSGQDGGDRSTVAKGEGTPGGEAAGQSGEEPGKAAGGPPGQNSSGNRNDVAAAGQSGQAGNRQGGRGQAPRLTGDESRNNAGAGADRTALDNLMSGGAAAGANNGGNLGGNGGRWAPITGDGYGQWSDHLRDIEEVVDSPDLRNEVASARERARLLRQDYTRNLKKPDWAVVQLQIIKPLMEVRNHISDELARRQSKDSLAPIDRDPVPNRYAESVRKYYEELGKEK